MLPHTCRLLFEYLFIYPDKTENTHRCSLAIVSSNREEGIIPVFRRVDSQNSQIDNIGNGILVCICVSLSGLVTASNTAMSRIMITSVASIFPDDCRLPVAMVMDHT